MLQAVPSCAKTGLCLWNLLANLMRMWTSGNTQSKNNKKKSIWKANWTVFLLPRGVAIPPPLLLLLRLGREGGENNSIRRRTNKCLSNGVVAGARDNENERPAKSGGSMGKRYLGLGGTRSTGVRL